MTRSLALGCATLLLSWAAIAHAQDKQDNSFEGLDLSGDSKDKKSEEKKDLPADQRDQRDQKTDTAPPPETPRRKAATAQPADAPVNDSVAETDVTQEDRVKAVQRKLYMKQYRFEISPFISVSVNDPYYTKWGGNLRLAFYPADSLAIAARFSYLQTLPTDDVRVAKRTFKSRIFFSVPNWMAMGDIEWSPFYGKVAFFNSILHVDAHLIAGMGAVYTETVALPGRTVAIGADLGVGLRFVAFDWLAVIVQMINTTYADQPAGTTKGAIQNVMMVNAGLSLFIPFKSTRREAE